MGWGLEHSLPYRHGSFPLWGKALAELTAGPCAPAPVGEVTLLGGKDWVAGPLPNSLCWVTMAHLKPESFKSHCIINRIYIKWATLCSS